MDKELCIIPSMPIGNTITVDGKKISSTVMVLELVLGVTNLLDVILKTISAVKMALIQNFERSHKVRSSILNERER
jgi:hypothetical protein